MCQEISLWLNLLSDITVVLVWPGPEPGSMRMARRRHDIHVCCKLVGLVLLFVFRCSSPQVLRTMVSEEGYMKFLTAPVSNDYIHAISPVCLAHVSWLMVLSFVHTLYYNNNA